jgi:hypothetical protein
LRHQVEHNDNHSLLFSPGQSDSEQLDTIDAQSVDEINLGSRTGPPGRAPSGPTVLAQT